MLISALSAFAAGGRNPEKAAGGMDALVRHQLLSLPLYGVFDNLQYQLDDGAVTLSGQVIRPTLKSEAEAAVRAIPGVRRVENRIEVLPLSSQDDELRLAVSRAIYGGNLYARYGLRADPAIHIVVANGRVTLEGAVGGKMDRQIAEMAANGVPGVFEVTNRLRVN